MIKVRPSDERGRGWHGWLDSRHSFSFADYYDPAHMGFRNLRVINEDWIQGGHGFPLHPHRDMEIVTWVIEGAVEHRDTAGNHGRIGPNELQRMTAGRGIFHSEYNASPEATLHLLQIWILPTRRGLDPGYGERRYAAESRDGRLLLVASPDGREGSVPFSADAEIRVGRVDNGPLEHRLAPGRGSWVQVIKGPAELNGVALGTGDGAAVEGVETLSIAGTRGAEVMVFDLGH